MPGYYPHADPGDHHNAVMSETSTTVSDSLKTQAGRRDVPLSEKLEKWLIAQKKTSRSRYVLAMQNHKPLTKSSYKSMWKLIERELPDAHIPVRGKPQRKCGKHWREHGQSEDLFIRTCMTPLPLETTRKNRSICRLVKENPCVLCAAGRRWILKIYHTFTTPIPKIARNYPKIREIRRIKKR